MVGARGLSGIIEVGYLNKPAGPISWIRLNAGNTLFRSQSNFSKAEWATLPIGFRMHRRAILACGRVDTDMSHHVHEEQSPPKTWEQFEELCADLFAQELHLENLVRHGRAGQAQSGVDIFARATNGWVGIQCKRKSRWPERRITKKQVDAEIEAARQFRPALSSFYIVTTAPDDAALQQHVRLIHDENLRKGHFEVQILGWNELCRRAALYPNVANKHFGSGAFMAPSPTLATFFAQDGKLELRGSDLELRCRELSHDFRRVPTGKVVLRQREADTLADMIARNDRPNLSPMKREEQLERRDHLARMEDLEAWISKGLTLLLGDPTISVYLFKVYRSSGDLVRAVTGFVEHELDPNKALIRPGTVRLKVRAPAHPDTIYQPEYMTQSEASSINSLNEKRRQRFGPSSYCETVGELPPEIRGGIAIPAIINAILRELDPDLRQLDRESTVEDLRRMKIFEISQWRAEVG